MQSLIKVFAVAAVMLSPIISSAHGYWIETAGNNQVNQPVTIKMFYGDYPEGEKLTGKTLDKMKDIKVFVTSTNGKKQELAMIQNDSCWQATFTPHSDGIYEITGINDVRDVQDWTKHKLGITRPVQYLKVAYQVGHKKTNKATPLFLDVDVNKKSSNEYELAVVKDGKKIPNQVIKLSAYGGKELELTTDKKGKIAFKLEAPALYIISIDWIDQTPGEFKGKKYETVRHRLDYSLYK